MSDIATSLNLKSAAALNLNRERAVVAAILLTFFVISIACFIFDDAPNHWPTVNGKVLHAETSEGNRNHVNISYTYAVNDKNYSCSTDFDKKIQSIPDAIMNPGASTTVFYSPDDHSKSTIAPGSRCVFDLRLALLFLGLIFAVIFIRPVRFAGNQIRRELPNFLDRMAHYLETGVAVREAYEKTLLDCSQDNQQLNSVFAKSLLALQSQNIPLHASLREQGELFHVDELITFGATLAASQMSHGDIAFQLRNQSKSMKYTQMAQQLSSTSTSGPLEGHQHTRLSTREIQLRLQEYDRDQQKDEHHE